MIKVSNLSKSFAGQLLFDQVNFSLNRQDRVGLVGRNGHGKTTLFRILLGQEEADSGQIVIPKDYSVGYLQQHLQFTQPTLLAEAALGLPADQHHEVWQAEKILFGLGFGAADMDRSPADFSGGFQVRLHLAKVLLSQSDLLLLDEPTNYLDIVSIRWLERFLTAWPGELMLITHDRRFMDSVVTHIMGIHRRKIRKLQGGTEKFFEQLAQEEAIHEKTRMHDDKKRREMEQFITRFRAKARLAGLVQSRIKTLEKSRKLEQLEKIPDLEFRFRSRPFPGQVMLEADSLAFRYAPTQPWLFNDLSFTVERHDRIAVIGKNGKGKTTLLRVLADELTPEAGGVKKHPVLETGYFGQTNIERLDPTRTIEEEFLASHPDCTRQKARDIAGIMMFSGSAAEKKIAVLSGGEKSRVLLGKLLLSPAHLLMLDEPTHHLDLESCEELMDAIDDFEGSVIMVTHDEMFLHQVATKFIVFDQDRVRLYTGSYQRFLDEVGWNSEDDDLKKNESTGSAAANPARKEQRREKARLIQEKSSALRPLEQEMRALEKTIETLEAELAQANRLLVEASERNDVAAIAELPKNTRQLEQRLGEAYHQLTAITQRHETLAAEFEARSNPQ